KRWFFFEKKVEFDLYERVVLVLAFRDEAYFKHKKVKIENLNFAPGMIYFFLYKNVPRLDLEFLFPNVRMSMTLKDRIMFGLPVLGGIIPIVYKALPLLSAIGLILLWYVMGIDGLALLDIEEDDLYTNAPELIAILSLTAALGGFAFKQYSNYKNKIIKLHKHVTDTLFFKNIATNSSVFLHVIDAAEEEECKELILAYYHLLTNPDPMTVEELDKKIEDWMRINFDTFVDFDIHGPLKNMRLLKAPIADGSQKTLLHYDEMGFCRVLPLPEATQLMSHIWTNDFVF
ncbi:MAG: TMEM143 family protein, partial [Chloroflexota bacterium]